MRRGDLAVACVALLLGLGTLLLTPLGVPGAGLASLTDMRSPAFFPILAALALVVLGALLLVKTLWRSPGSSLPPLVAPGRMLAVAAVLGGYGLAMPWLGMFSSSALAVLLLAPILGERCWWRVGLLAVLTPLLVYVLFERYLLILFPRGIWF